MGRRSVNTTKSGKFMNPTDQARKEARKRELKKNKKQRMAVRHAVLKAKDPLQLLEETSLAPGLPPNILPTGRKPPGPPPGTPPELSDSDGEDGSLEENVTKQRKIRFADTNAVVNNAIPPPLSQIPLPPPMALPSFTGLIRPGFPGAPQPVPNRFVYRPIGAVLSAPPSLHLRDTLDNTEFVNSLAVANSFNSQPNPSGTTIEAKPQLKNLIGDATRFVPTALKVRRTVRDTSGRLVTTGGGTSAHDTGKQSNAAYDRVTKTDGTSTSGPAASKDDVYEEFMREMEGLI
ncbi:unnamed protein product [Trichobilharzia regenti]|nr:unnamed protein product [Trichobilharzia regenti]